MLSYFDFTPESEDRDKDHDGLRRPCAVCKAVHIACDRGRPCGRCARLGKEHMCQDPPLQRRGRKPLILRSVHKHGEDGKSSPFGAPSQKPSAMADSQGRVIAASPEFCQLLGFSSEELVGLECQILPGGPNQPDYTSLLRGDMLSLLQAGASSTEQERDVVVDTMWVSKRGDPMIMSTQVISYIRDGALICSRLNILRLRPTASQSLPHVNSSGNLIGLSNSSSEPNSPGSASAVSSAPGSPRHLSPSPMSRFASAMLAQGTPVVSMATASSANSLAVPMTRPRSHSSPNPPSVPFVVSGTNGPTMPQLSLRVSNPSLAAGAASAPPSPQQAHLHQQLQQHQMYQAMRAQQQQQQQQALFHHHQQQQQQHHMTIQPAFPQHVTSPQGVFPFAVPLVDMHGNAMVSPRPPMSPRPSVPAISVSMYPEQQQPAPQLQQQLQQQNVQAVNSNSSVQTGWLSQGASSGAHTPSDDLTVDDSALLAAMSAEDFAASLLIWDDIPQQTSV